MVEELRQAAQRLASNPGFSIVAILTFALAIGANTTLFTIFRGVLVKPLPYERPDQILRIHESNPEAGLDTFSVSPPNFDDFRRTNQVFSLLAAYANGSFNLTGDGVPERLQGLAVSGDYFRLLGVRPQLGRLIQTEDDRIGRAEQVVVLNHNLWRQRFGGDPGIVNRTLYLDGEPRTVIGVLAPDFPQEDSVFVPLGIDYGDQSTRRRHFLKVLGRLSPGVSRQRAENDLKAIATQLAEVYPETNRGWTVVVQGIVERLVGDIRPALRALQAAVLLLLLIACANLANLTLARASLRDGEMGLRRALGASTWRLLRLFVSEGLILAVTGGLLGMLLSSWAVPSLLALGGERIPRAVDVRVDGGVLLFTACITALSGVALGLLPTLRAAAGPLAPALVQSRRGSGIGRGSRRALGLLLALQVALALVLLVGAGLLGKTLHQLRQVDPGFDSHGLLTARLELPESSYPAAAERAEFFRQVLERAAGLPGVDLAAAAAPFPLTGASAKRTLRDFARQGDDPATLPVVNLRLASPDFFRAMRIPLLSGREFGPADRPDSPATALVNESAARSLWPGRDALGQRIALSGDEASWLEVIGVVGDVRHRTLRDDPGLEVYLPLFRHPAASASLVLRVEDDPGTLASPLRGAVAELDPNLPLFDLRSAEAIVESTLAPERLNAIVLSIFGAAALILASLGVYGVISFVMAGRRHDIGVRLALGASRRQIVAGSALQGLAPVLWGAVAGLASSYFATSLLAALVYATPVLDPWVFGGATVLLGALGLGACLIPAVRASALDPATVLREA